MAPTAQATTKKVDDPKADEPTWEIVCPSRAKSTYEGPIWLEAEKSLLFNDGYNGEFLKWNSVTDEVEIRNFGEFITYSTFTVPHKDGGFVAGLNQKIIHFNWDDHKNYKVLAEVDQGKPTRLVDGKCDRYGRLFFATMGLEKRPAVPVLEMASLYSLDLDGTVKCHASGLHIANSMVWSNDDKTLYLTETIPGFIYAFDYDIETCTLSNRRIISYLPPVENGILDRMTIDTEGYLWTCYYRGGKATRIDPESGDIVRTIKLPCETGTCPIFGGANHDELFVTSSSYMLDIAAQPYVGRVIRIKNTGAKGFPVNVFGKINASHQ